MAALVAAGADVNARDVMGATPLHLANPAGIEVLVVAGADVNARDRLGFTPLHTAFYTTPAAVEPLLAAGADVNARDESGRTPLHFVARDNDSESEVELLLAAGADPMARAEDGDTPLHYAARGNGTAAVFEALLAAGADVHTRNDAGRTPLLCAAQYNENSVAYQTLLVAGADVNVRANDGQTLLHAAAHGENSTLVELLLKAGTDVNARAEDDETPLHVAARYSGWVECCLPSPIGLYPGPEYGSTAVVEVLLAAGADVNARDEGSWTPLHWAARFNKNPAILKVLLAAGADMDARNGVGDTSLYFASGRVPLEFREILRAHPLPSRPAGTDIEDVAVFRDCPMCPELLVVPAGRFRMGCVFESNACWSKDNLPAHEVDVASFALSKFEVTRGQFAAFVAATAYDIVGGCLYEPGSWRDQSWQSDDHPVVCVNWDDTQAYVQWLSEETGYRYRLPTESEWEYAARAGTKTRFYWGYRAPDLCKYANAGHCDDGWKRTAPVGSFMANGFGLYDMAGNVNEWVEDCWHENYDGAPRDGSAWTRGGDCGRHVARGGSWSGLSRHYRSADRDPYDVGFRFIRLGFRVARSLGEP